MGAVCRIGLDIAKNKFQMHGVDSNSKNVMNKQLNRLSLLNYFSNIPKCLVGLEACGGAHYWAREIAALGHDVRLISPRLVKPFVINNKTDAADARAICEVVGRPSTVFIQVKTVDQQALASLHRMRERLVGNRTALVNQARAFLLEIGIAIPQGMTHMRRAFPLVHQGEYPQCAGKFREILSTLYEEFLELDRRVEVLEKDISHTAKTDASCKRLLHIPGVGPLTATAIVSHVGDGKQFKNGRQFAACMGLTPRECSSGGKQKLLGISKRGSPYIRKLLIQGARVIVNWWSAKEAGEDYRKQWVQGLVTRRNKFVASVAQANKTARIIWSVLARGEDYRAQMQKA